jgi:hypothetical protein
MVFLRSEIVFSLEKCIMDQTCPVVHKSRRPQARDTHHAEGLVNPKVRALKKGY